MGLSDNLRDIEAEIAAGHPEQALTLCLELQTRYPRALAVQRVLGEAYLALRKPREALGALDRALAGNPEDARACCARAIVQQIHGDAASALKWYRRACDITPDDQVLRGAYRELAASQDQPVYRPTRKGLARLYLRGDLFSHALREWESLLTEEPDSLEVQVGLAETLWRAQRLQPATERCERILINAPACVKATLILAIIEHDAGHDEMAERLVRRTADLDPDCRIGQILCADRLAAGDPALQALLMGQETITSSPSPEEAMAPAGARVRLASEPLPEPSVLRNPPVKSQPIGSTNPLLEPRVPASQQRSSGLPANFRNMFAETEYMLWGKESDDIGEMSRASQMVTGNLPSPPGTVDQFARSNVFVPPVLRDQGVNLDETEARTSINFVNWLQAQGALQEDVVQVPPRAPITRQLPPLSPSQVSNSLPLSGPLTPQGQPWSSPGEPASFAATSSPEATSTTFSEFAEMPYAEQQPSVPSAQLTPKTDELRRMFAELGQQTGARNSAEEGFLAGEARLGTSDSGNSLEEELQRRLSGSGFYDAGTGADFDDRAHLNGQGQPGTPPDNLLAPQEVEPRDYPARLERARARLGTGQIDEALTDYRLVLKNAPDLLSDVMSDLNESLEEAPDHPEVHRLLGDAYIRQGNYLQALEAYNRAVALTQAQNG